MRKYKLTGFDKYDNLVIIDVLAESYLEAVYTANIFALDDIVLEESETFITNN